MAPPPRAAAHGRPPLERTRARHGGVVASFSATENHSTFLNTSGVFYWPPGADAWVDVSHERMGRWTKDVTIDPSDPLQNTWWAGVFTNWGGGGHMAGGLFRTRDRGNSWDVIFGGKWDTYRVNKCTVNPRNPNEAYFTTDGWGLWRSDDAQSAKPTFRRVDEYPFHQPMRVIFDPSGVPWVTSFGNGLRKARG